MPLIFNNITNQAHLLQSFGYNNVVRVGEDGEGEEEKEQNENNYHNSLIFRQIDMKFGR